MSYDEEKDTNDEDVEMSDTSLHELDEVFAEEDEELDDDALSVDDDEDEEEAEEELEGFGGE